MSDKGENNKKISAREIFNIKSEIADLAEKFSAFMKL